MASPTHRTRAPLTICEVFDLTDQVAFITGGALGISHGIGYSLAEAGATMVIADRKRDRMERRIFRPTPSFPIHVIASFAPTP